MAEIRGFILSLIAAASASALIDGFVPESGGMKKYVKYLISLILLLLLLSPLRELVGAIPALADAEYDWDSVEVMARANSIVAMHIESALCEKFSVDAADAQVTYDGERILVQLKRKLGLFESDIVLYIANHFGVEAEVVLYE